MMKKSEITMKKAKKMRKAKINEKSRKQIIVEVFP
jgi:hypothetical protein